MLRGKARFAQHGATRDFEWEFCVLHPCVRACGDLPMISTTRLRGTKPYGCGNASAGTYRGSGEKCRSRRNRRDLKVAQKRNERVLMCLWVAGETEEDRR